MLLIEVLDKARFPGYNNKILRGFERGGIIFYRKSVFKSLALVSQLGISIMTPIFLCTYIGYRIDRHFGTKLIIPFLILGILSGANMAYRLVKSVLRSRDEEENPGDKAKKSEVSEVIRPKTKSRIFKED